MATSSEWKARVSPMAQQAAALWCCCCSGACAVNSAGVSALGCRRRFVYVNIDACMASQLVTLEVISRLQAEYGGLYGPANVAISGTHTHASPAGFLQHALYSITSLGFVQQTFAAMVEGVVEVGCRRQRCTRCWMPAVAGPTTQQ